MINRKFADSDEKFKQACEKVGLPFSRRGKADHSKLGLRRQASKWKRQKGLAYKEGRF